MGAGWNKASSSRPREFGFLPGSADCPGKSLSTSAALDVLIG